MYPVRSPGTWRAGVHAVALMLALLAAGAAQALSLGDASLHSRIGEPLRVSIPLGSLGSLSAQEIVVGRAQDADYAKFGVERASFTSALKFELRVDPRGEATIEVSTEQPVAEPYVDMVVEVRWPTGKLVRQFTLLLELPPR
jgi:pilus assembly protein FimV